MKLKARNERAIFNPTPRAPSGVSEPASGRKMHTRQPGDELGNLGQLLGGRPRCACPCARAQRRRGNTRHLEMDRLSGGSQSEHGQPRACSGLCGGLWVRRPGQGVTRASGKSPALEGSRSAPGRAPGGQRALRGAPAGVHESHGQRVSGALTVQGARPSLPLALMTPRSGHHDRAPGSGSCPPGSPRSRHMVGLPPF